MNQYWPGEPLLVTGLNESIKPLTSTPFLRSLDDMLASWTTSIQVHLPEVADEASSIEVNSEIAGQKFAEKMALLFNNVQKNSDVLQTWINAIQKDLGLPAMTYGRCMVYATPDGKGTAPHFDQNINFVVQLSGTKKWWLAPNEHVLHPSQRHTIGQPVDLELAGYLEEALPSQMPANEKSYVLTPGSMLFVPQGYWHRTEASGDALALNFTFSQPSWVDLFTTALRSRLLLSPEWRELADGVSSRDPELKEMAVQKFDALLMELTHDLPNWNAQNILNSTESD